MAKKYNSAYDGTPIQIKRTELSLDKTTEKKTINEDGPLNYGEPLYLNYTDSAENEVDYLEIGDNKGTLASNLKVFKAIPRSYAEGTLFFDLNTRQDVSETNKIARVDLIDQNGNSIYTKFRHFTERDSNGATIDIATKSLESPVEIFIPKSNVDGTVAEDLRWYEVDENGQITTTVADLNTFPKAKAISITNMTEDTIPFISLALSNAQSKDSRLSKKIKKAFGNVSDVESKDGKIIIYCNYRNITQACYINVFGG